MDPFNGPKDEYSGVEDTKKVQGPTLQIKLYRITLGI